MFQNTEPHMYIYSRLKLKILLHCPLPYVLGVHVSRGRFAVFLF